MKKTHMKNEFRQHCLHAILMILAALFLMAPAATHANEGITLRVAFCPLEGFFEYDANGNETGYGVDILDKITQYSGIRFEYVPAKEWEDTKTMLKNGDVDIRMPVTQAINSTSNAGFTQNPIALTSHVLMSLKTRTDLYYEDYEAVKKIKIGITKGLYDSIDFHSMAMGFGVPEENLIYYETYDSEYEALKRGDIDAVVSNIMDMTSDLKLLVRFDSVPNYIEMSDDNIYLSAIDNVIVQINTDEPEYITNLTARWFPDKNEIPLTKEETEYINSLGELTFVLPQGQGFLSMKEKDGSYTGFYPEMAKKICNELGVDCNQISDTDETGSGVAIYPDFYFDYEWADEKGISLTLPYFTERYYEVSEKNSRIDEASCKIAAVKDMRATQDFIADSYGENQIVWCSDYAACIRAVKKGEADITYVSSYAAEYYLSMYRYANLGYSLTAYSNKVSFGVKGDADGTLLTILYKLLEGMPDEEIDQLLTQSTSNQPAQDIMQEWIVSNPTYAFAMAGGIGAVLVTVILVIVFANRTKMQNIKLKKATEAKSEFLSRMSHDIRTPLNVIIGMNQLARENDNPPDTQDCLEKISISSDFLLGLINDVLDMERVENGKMELHLSPYSGSEFRSYIETIIQPLCEQKNIRFDYRYDSPENFVVMQDKLKIHQIYFNLLSNAVKYTPEGGTISFHTLVEVLSDKKVGMHVTIADTGIGMSKEFQDHMFDAFSQENQVMSSVSQGTGLGLTIVKRMCDLMKMKISVDSDRGKGTTYHLYGEYDIARESDIHRQVLENRGMKDLSVLKEKVVLVCEDHMLNQDIIHRLLEKQGIIVDMAEDGNTGVEKFRKSSPGAYDAILMDIRMPIMNGLEAARAIRTLKRKDAQSVPIIAMTANAYAEDIEKSLKAGMNAHLTKPIDAKLLYETLAESMENGIR
jgi:signal transduction histidine kinase/CheY-like chemotaxis protein/ABC-type amino acid transport substrate-binding protein